ncbi:MAG: hypothetical protein IJH63_00655 [Methanobrevibacter sp.]|nr:hypothetical protein [Methanosphaera sp.]MBR0369214.1 hypothetical protein [Methanobrevibacter sp.]
MIDISFDEEDFVVTSKVYDLGEHTGVFRVVRYSAGYYALQACVIDEDNSDSWKTVCVSPYLDTPLDNEYDWKFSQGRLDMNFLLNQLRNSSKLQDNELMELHLHLNKELDDTVRGDIIETIRSDDGRNILDKIYESLELQDEFVEKELKDNNLMQKLLFVYLIIVTVIILLVMFM